MNIFATITKNSIQKFPRVLYQDIFPKMKEDDILLVVENNSTDGTKEFLKDLVRDKKIVHIECDMDDPPKFPPVAIKERADFLASLRQKCVDWVNKSKLEPKYFIVFDSDMDQIPDKNWDSMFTDHAVVASNGLDIWTQDGQNTQGVMYDSWSYYELDSPKVQYGQDNYPVHPPEGLKQVRSAFGGVSVNRWSLVKNAKYHWLETPNATEDERYKNSGLCEHAGWASDIIKQGGKVFLNTEYYPIRNANNVLLRRA